MITVIRRQIKSKLFKYVLWFFVIILGIVFIMPNLGDRLKGPQWVARVNNREIDIASFYRAVSKQEYNIRVMREQYGAYADVFMQMLGLARDPKILAYEELVRESVVDDVADHIPLYIHGDYVDQKFNDPMFIQQSGLYNVLPLGFFTPQGIDQQSLRFYLSRMGLSFTQFETMVEQALARYIALELSSIANYTPSYLVQGAMGDEIAKRKYAIISFSLDEIEEEERKKEIADTDLKAFFDTQNKGAKRYWVPEQRAGIIWKFNPVSYGTSVSQDELQDYYDKHKVRKYIEAPSQIQVRRILLKLSETEPKELLYQRAQALRSELMKNPDAFAQKAKEVSEDDESAKDGGLLPFFSKGDRDPVFEKKSYLLKDGAISEVFQTADGLEIVQRVKMKPKKYKSLSVVKDEIKKTLLQQAFAKQFTKDMRRVLDSTGVDENALEVFVKEKKSESEEVPFSSKDDSMRMRTFFKLKKGEAGFFVDGDTGYIVQLNEIKKRYLPQLENVKATVTSHLIDERAQKTLQKRLEEAKLALGEESPQAVAKKLGGSLQETDFLRKDAGVEGLKEKGIPVDKMLQLGKKGLSAFHIADNTGYVFYVADVAEVDTEELQEKKPVIENRLHNERKALFIQGFVASLSRNATIETNNSVFNLNESQAV